MGRSWPSRKPAVWASASSLARTAWSVKWPWNAADWSVSGAPRAELWRRVSGPTEVSRSRQRQRGRKELGVDTGEIRHVCLAGRIVHYYGGLPNFCRTLEGGVTI